MSTRFYFPETLAADVSPAISGTDWSHVNTLRRKLLRTVDASTLTTTAYTPDAADHLVAGQAHHRQYVSDPLAAQTISGSVKAQFQCLEANANNNLNLTLKLWVCTNDGSGQSGSNLLNRTSKGTEPTTALRNTSFSIQALTNSVAALAGDRLVVEVGFNGTPAATTGTQGHNGSFRFGGNASSGDLPEDETQAGTTFRPWIEFTADIVLNANSNPQAIGMGLAGVVPVMNLGVVTQRALKVNT